MLLGEHRDGLMISYEDSQQILSSELEAHSFLTEYVDLKDSLGRVLSHDLISPEAHPRFNHSAMDGFAFCHDSLKHFQSSQGYLLEVSECVLAGNENFAVADAQAIEIMTGASLPSAGFDTVIRLEDVTILENPDGSRAVSFQKAPARGANVRCVGEDIVPSQLLLKAGSEIHHRHLIFMASLGIRKIQVIKKVPVALVSTGRELVDYAESSLSPVQIRNATGLYLESCLMAEGHSVSNLGIIGDDPDLFLKEMSDAFLEGAELFISTGAVSKGKYDFVREAMKRAGARVHFHGVAIRPGKPVLFASLPFQGRMRYIFGIPGNISASLVGLHFFVLPFLRGLSRKKVLSPTKAELIEDVKIAPSELRSFLPARLCSSEPESQVQVIQKFSPAWLSPFLISNCWVSFPEHTSLFPRGSRIEVFHI